MSTSSIIKSQLEWIVYGDEVLVQLSVAAMVPLIV